MCVCVCVFTAGLHLGEMKQRLLPGGGGRNKTETEEKEEKEQTIIVYHCDE